MQTTLPPTSASSLLGAAGEHFVMSQLLRQGFIAALAPVGVPQADIIVTDTIGDRLCAIQVKTRRALGSDGGWHMRAKHETFRSPTLFYVFVDFGTSTTSQPACFVIPSALVADTLQRSHQTWLAQPGQHGQAHNDGDMRRLLPGYAHLGLAATHPPGWLESYRDAWPLLRSGTDASSPNV